MEEATESPAQLPDLSVIDLDGSHGQDEATEEELESGTESKENQPVSAEEEQSSQYSHPVYKELSILNGRINKLNVAQLKSRLREHKLSTSGRIDVLRRRLKAHLRAQKLKEQDEEDKLTIQRNLYYDYYLVIDFEATCDDRQNQATYRHEIIEFPAQLVSTKKARVVDEFHSHVRPVVNPKLTTFCTNLTGITQDMVNFAPSFPEVLEKFNVWLEGHKLNTPQARMTVLTDGPWDMGRFLHQQCRISQVPYPSWGKKWINIRKSFSNFYNTKRMCLKDMLTHVGMGFQGQPHCGLDDSRNIARVAIRLLMDGANMRVNEKIVKNHGSFNPGERVVRNVSCHEFEGMKKKLLIANETDTSTPPDESNQGNESDSDCDESNGSDNEPLWPDTGDKNEFPDLINAGSIKRT
ncbi:3'-5' exoribonuclease 1-like isoform X3 [Eriocheir sinensis]|nr:3'-5' exoribonuclease 1-like isoform X3 [Eriocheir sinensis]XP_050713232.1 3'-5' exoribonuclease 1-like isoform X3 [Eriocheir sinensis]